MKFKYNLDDMSKKRKQPGIKSDKDKEQRNLLDCWGNTKKSSSDIINIRNEQHICPICNASLWVDISLTNLHIDKCLSKVEILEMDINQSMLLEDDSYINTLSIIRGTELKGLTLIHNFITMEEESLLINLLDSNKYMEWKFSSFNGNCYSKYFGLKTQFGLPGEQRLVRENGMDVGESDIPEELFPFMNRFRRFVELNPQLFPPLFRDFRPNECNVNSYKTSEGHYLRPHFDDRALSGPILMNLSLCGDAKMTFAKPVDPNLPTSAIATGKFGHTVQVPLPRRCLQLVAGDARWNYTHEIRKEDILDPRRMSITWRQAGGKAGIQSRTAPVGQDVATLLRKQQSQQQPVPVQPTQDEGTIHTAELVDTTQPLP